MKLEPVFKTEAELCAAFIEWAKQRGYTAYPETAGWDILLVDKDGWQIGVEAKLKLNTKVLYQAIDCYNLDVGPDHRAVLVPERTSEWREFCGYLGIEIFYCESRPGNYWGREPRVHHFQRDNSWNRQAMFDWNPKKRCALPEYIPDVAAGVPAPIQLTPWKVGALKVMAHLDVHGSITRKQIKGYGIDNRRWCTEWLLPLSGDRRDGNWVRGSKCPSFDQQHATVYAQIRAEIVAAGAPAGQLEVV